MVLNKKWTKAMMIAETFPVANEARIAVVVVPMLAPIVSGNTASTVRMPAATSGISKEVVIELDWTKMVKISPAKIASTPLFPIILFMIISDRFATSVLMIFTMK